MKPFQIENNIYIATGSNKSHQASPTLSNNSLLFGTDKISYNQQTNNENKMVQTLNKSRK